jgi:hypothetical protein
MSPDQWTHQYLALPNQPFANEVPDWAGLWWNDQVDSITYAIAPNYPCCAVNHPQGWPKFLASVYALAGDNGLAATQLAPATVSTKLNDGTDVTVSSNMTYPFTPVLSYSITASAPFTFYMRVPQWQSAAPNVTINGTPATAKGPDDHQMLAISIPAGTSAISASLAPEIVVEPRANNTAAIHYGPLLYALDLGQDITNAAATVDGAPPQAQTVYYNNTAPWNMAINTSTLAYFGPTADNASSVVLPNPVFDYQAPPSYMTVDACPIAWDLFHGVPAPVPLDGSRTCTGDVATVTLRPYGSLRARMAEFPLMGS